MLRENPSQGDKLMCLKPLGAPVTCMEAVSWLSPDRPLGRTLGGTEALRRSPAALNSEPWWYNESFDSAVSLAPAGRPAGHLELQQMCGPR